MEDELRFGADHYLKKLAERRSFLEKFWGGIKVTCIFMAFVSLCNFTVMEKSKCSTCLKTWLDKIFSF